MLKKKERLKTADFNRSFSSGIRKHSRFFTFIHESGASFHAAVVVGKKIFKSAVKRNRLRRQIYDILYRIKKSQNVTGTYIVLVKGATTTVPFATLKEELFNLLSSISQKANKG
jgi:ribonuclease P protein component